MEAGQTPTRPQPAHLCNLESECKNKPIDYIHPPPSTYPDDDVPRAVHAVLVYLRSHQTAHHIHQLVVVLITGLIIINI